MLKKIITIILILFSISTFINYKVNLNKSKDISYVVEHYLTSGLFNKYKLYSTDSIHLSFSDNSIAVVDVTGKEKKSPHPNVKYKLFLEKNKKGAWKVKKVYTDEK